MQHLVTGMVIVAVCATAFTYGREKVEVWQCGKLARDGESGFAREFAERGTSDDKIFTDQESLKSCRDNALVASTRKAIEDRDFNLAVAYLNQVSEKANDRARAEANSLRLRLPEIHINWASELVDNNKFDAALAEINSMKKLYAKDDEILIRVRELNAKARVLKAEVILKSGPVPAVLVILRDLDRDIPLVYRDRTEQLIASAVTSVAEEHLGKANYPALFRWLATAKKDVAQLHSVAMESVEAAYMQKVFDVPASADLKDTASPPPVVAVESKQKAERTTLKVGNQTGKNMAMQIVGRQPKHKFEIAAGGEKEIALPAGEYVQFIAGGEGVRPYLGIFRIDGHSYRQNFAKLQSEGDAVKSLLLPEPTKFVRYE